MARSPGSELSCNLRVRAQDWAAPLVKLLWHDAQCQSCRAWYRPTRFAGLLAASQANQTVWQTASWTVLLLVRADFVQQVVECLVE